MAKGGCGWGGNRWQGGQHDCISERQMPIHSAGEYRCAICIRPLLGRSLGSIDYTLPAAGYRPTAFGSYDMTGLSLQA